MAKKISVVFFGSGPVALQSLRGLVGTFSVEAIVTKPATQEEMQRAVPEAMVYSVATRKELDTLIESTQFSSELGLLIDFGVIVSEAAINMFPFGIINSHFSLLPEWRGADPITFSILGGGATTGVSLMLLTAGMDEGPVLREIAYDMSPSITTPELTSALINISNDALKDVIPEYLDGNIKPMPQAASNPLGITQPTYSKKLRKVDGLIDWTKPAAQLEREIRAYITWPKSYTTLANREVTLTLARVVDTHGHPGRIIVDGKRLVVCCGDKSLEILQLKPAGKQLMSAEAFLAGYRQHLQ